MVNQQLLDYIRQQLQQGISREQIKSSLIANGWQEKDIQEGFVPPSASGGLSETDVSFQAQAPNKLWKFLAGFLLSVLLIGGIYLASQIFLKSEQNPNTQTSEDCKQDFDCFIQASQSCKLAKVDHTVVTNILGVEQTTKSFLEIKGTEASRCNFFLRTEKIDLTFPASVPPETVSQQKEIYKKLEGRSGSCKFDTSDLTAMLTRWEKGNFESGNVSCKLTPSGNVCKTEGGDFGVAECQGTYFEQPSL